MDTQLTVNKFIFLFVCDSRTNTYRVKDITCLLLLFLMAANAIMTEFCKPDGCCLDIGPWPRRKPPLRVVNGELLMLPI